MGCSQGHLNSTYQEHATIHDPKTHQNPNSACWNSFQHQLESIPTKTFEEASQNMSENNSERTIYFNKTLGNTLATSTKVTSSGTYLLGDLLYSKHTEPPEEARE